MNSAEKIRELLKTINGESETITVDEDLFSLGILDSLGMARLIPAVEKEFDIEIDIEDIVPENFTTIRDIANLLKNYEARK